MPVFLLGREPIFPAVELSEKNGLLALGGDLSPERLKIAYEKGIFPWFGEDDPILWWSPDPRLVLYPDKLHVSQTLRQALKKEIFQITFDRSFREVITACREKRDGEGGTWITAAMVEGYCRLHEQGLAHSCEAWHDGELAGGLYGVSLGACFFGESMFSRVSNASKAALVALTGALKARDFALIDCQVDSPHLRRMGAELIPRKVFLKTIEAALKQPTLQGKWTDWA